MARILLVDDDVSFRPMLQAKLEWLGHEVIVAGNGNEALARYGEWPIDLVLTDLIMPDKEGIELISELRRRAPGVAIVAMSGGGRVSPHGYLGIARHVGATQVLAKPFSSQELVGALEAALAAGLT